MGIFDRFINKSKLPLEPKQQSVAETKPIVKNFVDFGLEILEKSDFPDKEKEEIRRFLIDKWEGGLRGAEHITDHEADIFIQALKSDRERSVEVIDLGTTQDPSADLTQIQKKYPDNEKQEGKAPILFLLHCNPQRLDEIDSDFSFDAHARHLLQDKHWTIFLTGDMRFAKYSGSIAPNFTTSRSKAKEQLAKRRE